MNGLITDISDLTGLNNSYTIGQGKLSMPYNEGFIKSSDVYAIVSRIARDGKGLDWKLKKKTGAEVEDVESGELYDLIKNPNKSQSRQEFTEMGLLFYLLSGEAFLKTDAPLGFLPESVELLNPQFIQLITDLRNQQNELIHYNFFYGGNGTRIEKELITHLKYANPTIEGFNSMRGLSPLIAGYLTLVGLNNNQSANATILENQGVAGILSNEGEVALTEEERKQSQGVLDKLISGVRNFGKVLQSSSKVRYTRLGLDPTQLRLIESKILKMRDLCNIYNVKSNLFNDVAASSMNNLILAEKSYWHNAVIPNTQSLVTSFEKGVVSKFNEREFPNKRSKYFIHLDTSKIIAFQEDEQKKASKGKLLTESMVNILTSGLSIEQQIQTLIFSHGFTVDEAKQIVGNGNNSQSNSNQ